MLRSLRKLALLTLLLACANASVGARSSYAQAPEDFIEVPAGSRVVLASGDSILVTHSSYLVSDSAVAAIDLSIRSLESDLDASRANEADRLRQLEIRDSQIDSLTVNLAAERAWRNIAEKLMSDQHGGLPETLENFSLTVGGFAVCRLTEPRS